MVVVSLPSVDGDFSALLKRRFLIDCNDGILEQLKHMPFSMASDAVEVNRLHLLLLRAPTISLSLAFTNL